MRLRYMKKDGTQMEFEVGERPITIGRSPEADVVILDEKASRLHCGIRLWDGEFYIKDLKSRNGTYLNEDRIDVAKLKLGDQIRVGSVVFSFDSDPAGRSNAALQEMEDELAKGKGYSTILREIVNDIKKPAVSDDAVATANGASNNDNPIRVNVKKPKQE